MRIPSNMTEDEVMAVIENVARRLARKYQFGYHEKDDMMQYARMVQWQALAKYDEERPLENFLWTACRNGLFNLKRNQFQRPNKPCLKCPFNSYDKKNDACLKYEDLSECKPYYGWVSRNESKKNILLPIELGAVGGAKGEKENNMCISYDEAERIDQEEVFDLIDKHMPIPLRPDWIRMKSGIRLTKPRHTKVVEAAQEILTEHNLYGT